MSDCTKLRETFNYQNKIAVHGHKCLHCMLKFVTMLQSLRDKQTSGTFASHQFGLGLIPGLDVLCGLSLLLVLVFAPRCFSLGSLVFPSPQKSTFPNSNLIQNVRATGLSVMADC